MKTAATELLDGLLASPVTGTNLRGKSLGEQLDQGPTLMVFLRHFG